MLKAHYLKKHQNVTFPSKWIFGQKNGLLEQCDFLKSDFEFESIILSSYPDK